MQSVLRPERELEHRRERVSVEARSSSRAAAAMRRTRASWRRWRNPPMPHDMWWRAWRRVAKRSWEAVMGRPGGHVGHPGRHMAGGGEGMKGSGMPRRWQWRNWV